MKWSLKTSAAPTTNAVTSAEAKSQCRIDHSDDDTYITHLIVTAQDAVESYTGRKLMEGTYVLQMDEWPTPITIPYVPVKSISSVKYYNASNVLTTLDTAEYYYDIYQEPCTIWVKDGDFPDLYDYRVDNIQVTFKSGYTSPDAVPSSVKHAILILISDMYEFRLDRPREKFSTWKMLCHPYRLDHV